MRAQRLVRLLVIAFGAIVGVLALSGLASAQVPRFGQPSFGTSPFGPSGFGGVHTSAGFAARPGPPVVGGGLTTPSLAGDASGLRAAASAATFVPPSPALLSPSSALSPASAWPSPFFGGAFASGINTSILPIAISGPAVAVNVGVVNAGPIGGITGQIGNNIVIAPQFSFAHSGAAIAGSQIGGFGFFNPFFPFTPFSTFGGAGLHPAFAPAVTPFFTPFPAIVDDSSRSGVSAVVGPSGASFRSRNTLTTIGPSGVVTDGPAGSAVFGPNGLVANSGSRARSGSSDGTQLLVPFGPVFLPFTGGTFWYPSPALYSAAYLSPFVFGTGSIYRPFATGTWADSYRRTTLRTIGAHSVFPAWWYGGLYSPFGHRTVFAPRNVIVSGFLGSFIASEDSVLYASPFGSFIASRDSYQASSPFGSVIAGPSGVVWSTPFLGGGILGYPYLWSPWLWW